MRKCFLLAVLMSVITPAFADVSPAAPAPAAFKTMKIGVVDVRAVVQQSPQLHMIDSQLTQKYKPREQAIIAAQANFKTEEDRLNKDGATMAEPARTKLQQQVINDRARLQAMITSFQQDLDVEQNSDMQKLLSQIASIVNDLAKADHYDLILQGDNIPYVSDELNLTNTILRKLSNKA